MFAKKILLVIFFCLFFSCASTSIQMNLPRGNSPNFHILQANDPLNLNNIIMEEISKRGHSVNITYAHDIAGEKNIVVVQIYYSYHWDVFHYTSSRLRIDFTDANTGIVAGSGSHNGGSFHSARRITRNIINQMLDKI